MSVGITSFFCAKEENENTQHTRRKITFILAEKTEKGDIN
jgi:hypothetical protein